MSSYWHLDRDRRPTRRWLRVFGALALARWTSCSQIQLSLWAHMLAAGLRPPIECMNSYMYGFIHMVVLSHPAATLNWGG